MWVTVTGCHHSIIRKLSWLFTQGKQARKSDKILVEFVMTLSFPLLLRSYLWTSFENAKLSSFEIYLSVICYGKLISSFLICFTRPRGRWMCCLRASAPPAHCCRRPPPCSRTSWLWGGRGPAPASHLCSSPDSSGWRIQEAGSGFAGLVALIYVDWGHRVGQTGYWSTVSCATITIKPCVRMCLWIRWHYFITRHNIWMPPARKTWQWHVTPI